MHFLLDNPDDAKGDSQPDNVHKFDIFGIHKL